MKPAARKRDPDAKLSSLHKSAFALLAEQRYQDVPVSLIAAHAGVAVGTFYRFYPTKMALLEAMSDALEEEFVLAMQAAWDRTDHYSDKIAELSSALFDTISARKTEIGVMQMTAGHRSNLSKPMGELVRQEIARLYLDGSDNGGFEKHDPHIFAAAGHGVVEGLMRQFLQQSGVAKKEEYKQILTTMLLRLVAA
jgi:AcrR family transcriptional regulator